MVTKDREDDTRIPGKRRRCCESCGALRYDVKRRGDGYAQDVQGKEGAEHTVCDRCDHERSQDI